MREKILERIEKHRLADYKYEYITHTYFMIYGLVIFQTIAYESGTYPQG